MSRIFNSNKYYPKKISRNKDLWHICSSTTHLPVYDHYLAGDDKPIIFTDADQLYEALKKLNSETQSYH